MSSRTDSCSVGCHGRILFLAQRKSLGFWNLWASKVSGPFQIPGVDDEEMGSSPGGIWREILGADYTLAASVV